jgi:DNA-binding NtrC family response regulator
MNGSLAIESTPGTGTTISLLLQQPVGPIEDSRELQSEHRVSIVDRKILVLEDDPGSREALELFLTHHGAEVRGYGTLDEALDAIRGGEYVPEQILIDFDLGDGPNGIGAIAMIREQIGSVSAALITGAPLSAEMVPEDIALLRKPHSDSKLLSFLERGVAENKT